MRIVDGMICVKLNIFIDYMGSVEVYDDLLL